VLPATQPEWIATTATVTTCRYQFARMNTLTLGMGTGDRFRITFDYYAHGRLYSGEFQSRVAIPQNEKISLRYNPLNPEQNSRSRDDIAPGRSAIYGIGIAGSILLSLAWLAIVRGCR
jgi:hypothetical protein